MTKLNSFTVFGLALLIIFALAAVFAPVLAPFNPDELTELEIQGPSPKHWFGTDDLGRDLLSRSLYGARVSLSVGMIAVVSWVDRAHELIILLYKALISVMFNTF